jgi:hypothetical protein
MMTISNFDPRKFIDREFEHEMFEELLQFRDNARILAFCDSGGMGKTQLLQKFQYRCRIVKPRTPVSLIALDQLEDNTPLTLVKTIIRDLGDYFGLEFPNFNKYYYARISGDFMPFSSVSLENADFQGASDIRIAGMDAVGAQKVNVNVNSAGDGMLTPEQQVKADDVCIRAFFDDLKQHCVDKPVVLLLDAYERCAREIKEWIEGYFLQRCFFDLENRPARFVLVMTGRELPEFEKYWASEDIETVVGSVRQLRKWEKRHVEEMLRVHGFAYKPEHVEVLFHMLELGHPPSVVVQASHMIFEGAGV